MNKPDGLYSSISAMEPLLPDDTNGMLEELAVKLIKASAKLSTTVHPTTRLAIADFLRPMNSYYSNLIEGHDTHPLDIDKALRGDYSNNEAKRSFQLEAYAHIKVHKYLSKRMAEGEVPRDPYAEEFLKLIHKKFYEHLPITFKTVKTEEGNEKEVIPGEFRNEEVKVGNHIAPSSKHLTHFTSRFDSFYSTTATKSSIERIIAIAAAHHRLAWIHPFLDGNGRVVRLHSDTLFMLEGLDASGLWYISRGLARNNDTYKSALANADLKRIDDYDGRGNLSNKMLVSFCKFFLEVAIDQAEYMAKILDANNIVTRLEGLTELLAIKKGIKRESKHILIDLFLKGSISKGDVMRITNTSDKTAKLITDKLEEIGLLTTVKEPGKKALYFPSYPINYSPSLFPGLYPNSKETDLLNNL